MKQGEAYLPMTGLRTHSVIDARTEVYAVFLYTHTSHATYTHIQVVLCISTYRRNAGVQKMQNNGDVHFVGK